MKSKVFGIVDSQGLIVNAVYWDEQGEYPLEDGFSIVCIDGVENCGIGWSYINGEFIDPHANELDPTTSPQPEVSGAQTL